MTSLKLRLALGSMFVAMLGCNSILGINEPIVQGGSSGVTPTGTCAILQQTGCEASQTCTAVSPTTTGCVTAGSNEAGNPCEDESLCAPGLKCYLGVCREFCNPDTEEPCGNGGPCSQLKLSQGSELVDVPGVGTCFIPCQLDDPQACGGIPGDGPVAGCSGVGGVTNCVTRQRTPNHECWNLAVAEVGDGHAGDVLCDPGTVCTPFGCNPPCPVNGGGSGCVGGRCVAYDDGYQINGEESGYCGNDP